MKDIAVTISADISGKDFPCVTWDGTKDSESLNLLRDFVVRQAEEASTWYLSRRHKHRYFGRAIRLLALAATSIAGIIPIISQIFTQDGKATVPPAWASVALAVAAAGVAIDYFFGFSSGWMRYMAAQQKIVRLLREFEFDWETLRAGLGEQKPAVAQVAAALTRLKLTALQVQQTVEEETNSWIAEFRNSLRLIDEAAKAKLEAPTKSAINVVVTNASQVTEEWTLTVDDGTRTCHRGTRAALVGLTPGAHKVYIEGRIDTQLRRDEAAIFVPATGIGEVTLTLK
jgi:conflict system pore-forming effector with SLATT domain